MPACARNSRVCCNRWRRGARAHRRALCDAAIFSRNRHRRRVKDRTMEIKGQAAIVTGGASGLGAATARALAAAGAKVAIFDLNEKGAAEVAAGIKGIAVACDIANAEGAKAAVETASTVHGPARILVNCAGIGPAKRIVGRDGPMPLEEYEKVSRINLIGSLNMMRLAAAAMQPLQPFADGERGVIRSTASVPALEGKLGQAP